MKIEKPGLAFCLLVGDFKQSQEFSEGSTGSVQMLMAKEPACCVIVCGMLTLVWEILLIRSLGKYMY